MGRSLPGAGSLWLAVSVQYHLHPPSIMLELDVLVSVTLPQRFAKIAVLVEWQTSQGVTTCAGCVHQQRLELGRWGGSIANTPRSVCLSVSELSTH